MRIQAVEEQDNTYFSKIHDPNNRLMYYVVSDEAGNVNELYARDLINNNVIKTNNEDEIGENIKGQLNKVGPGISSVMQEFFIVEEIYNLSTVAYEESYIFFQDKHLNGENITYQDIKLFTEDLYLQVQRKLDFATLEMFEEIIEKEAFKVIESLEAGVYI